MGQDYEWLNSLEVNFLIVAMFWNNSEFATTMANSSAR